MTLSEVPGVARWILKKKKGFLKKEKNLAFEFIHGVC